MKVAVTYGDGMVYEHFGHCKSFKIYNIEKGEVVSSEIVSAPGTGHTSAVNLLIEQGVYALICGNIGYSAQSALMLAFIDVFSGCTGKCDDKIAEFLGKRLHSRSQPNCAGHSGENNAHMCGGCHGGCGSECGGCC